MNNKELDDMVYNNKLKKLSGGLILTEGQIAVLTKFGIMADECKTLNDLMFLIMDFINNNEDLTDEDFDELDLVSEEIAERNYYLNTNK